MSVATRATKIGLASIMALGITVACSATDDSVACAATKPPPPRPAAPKPAAPKPAVPAQPQQANKPAQPKKVEAPRPVTVVAPVGVAADAPKSDIPARKGYPQQYKPTKRASDGYRYYPGYAGWYPVGVYPVGYTEYYGCTPPETEE